MGSRGPRTFLAGSLGELPVAPLMRRPPVPVVEALAVLLVLAAGRPVGLEDEPLAKPGVGRHFFVGTWEANFHGNS